MTSRENGPWTVVFLLSVAFILNYIDRQVVFAIFPVLRADMSFSPTQLGLAGSVFTWTYSLGMPFAGRLADVIPRHRLIIIALILWSLATIGTGISRNFTEFIISRVLMGLSESLYSPAAMALIARFHTNRTRSRALSVHGLAQFIGITFGGWYGGWAAENIGWRTGLIILAVIGLGYAVVLGKFLRDRPIETTEESIRSSPLKLLRSLNFWAISTTFFCFCAMLWMLYAWLPTYIFDTFNLSLAQSGLVATLYLQSSSAVGVLTGGLLGDYFAKSNPIGRFRVLTLGLFVAAPFAFFIFEVESLALLKLSACVFGLFTGLFIANMFSSVYDLVEKNNYGLAVGLINMLGGLGAGAAILATGMFKEMMAFSSLMMWATLSSMASSLWLAYVIHRYFAGKKVLSEING